jgi:hypothetical protein
LWLATRGSQPPRLRRHLQLEGFAPDELPPHLG